MIGKLTAKDSNRNRPFNARYIKVEDIHPQVRTEVIAKEIIKIGTD